MIQSWIKMNFRLISMNTMEITNRTRIHSLGNIHYMHSLDYVRFIVYQDVILNKENKKWHCILLFYKHVSFENPFDQSLYSFLLKT